MKKGNILIFLLLFSMLISCSTLNVEYQNNGEKWEPDSPLYSIYYDSTNGSFSSDYSNVLFCEQRDDEFIILNMSDIQINNLCLDDNSYEMAVFKDTADTLISKTQPDLITFTGDFGDYSNSYKSLNKISKVLDSYGILWAPVFGNHDNEGPIVLDKANTLENLDYCLFRSGPDNLATIIKYARFNTSLSPNLMAKVPATEEGLKAIEVLIKEGIPINATECMAVRQVLDVCEIYKKCAPLAKKPAPVYFSLITGIYDEYLHNYVKDNNVDISEDVLWQAGMAVAKKVHALVKERKYNVGFIGGGARGLHHYTEMVGADAVVTINWKGTADKLLEMDAPVVQRFLQPTPYSVEDELVEKLPDFRKAYFINAIDPKEYEDFGPVVLFRNSFVTAWKNALSYIADQRKKG